jgi:sarcosine oxidase subunit alpha
VLSALLVSGVRAAGIFGSSPIALDEYTAPAIALSGNEGRPDLAMPMALCPAVDGASFVSFGPGPDAPASPLARLLLRKRNALGLLYRSGSAEPGGWIDIPASRRIAADVAVVGGGVAGLSAALAAAQRGLRVCLVEKEATLGGLSVFFGKADGEPAPEEMIGDLVARIGASGLVTLLLGTLAFDLEDRRIEAIRVTKNGSAPQPERISIAAETVVLATGTVGRIPIFAGNRLPDVVEAGFAWRMAARYNVWPGENALIHTTTNVGYRMALLGAASGKTILRAADPRIDPQTRFIEFCKAYGYRLGWGVAIAAAVPTGKGLSVATADAETGALSETPTLCDRLIVSGGWQPDLDLWVRSGGAVIWDAAVQRLVPSGAVKHVVLAGSATGYVSLAGCVDHGRIALEIALGGLDRPAPDPRIDPIFETPDGPLTLARPPRHGGPSAFVASGATRALETPPARGWGRLTALAPGKAGTPWGPLTLPEVAGAVVAGQLDPDHVPGLCAERCVLPRTLAAAEPPHPSNRHAQDGLPAYLEHRFANGQAEWVLALDQQRRFDPGCPIFANTDHRSPLDAIGLVLSGEAGAIRALIAEGRMQQGDTVYIRDGQAALGARLDRRL